MYPVGVTEQPAAIERPRHRTPNRGGICCGDLHGFTLRRYCVTAWESRTTSKKTKLLPVPARRIDQRGSAQKCAFGFPHSAAPDQHAPAFSILHVQNLPTYE